MNEEVLLLVQQAIKEALKNDSGSGFLVENYPIIVVGLLCYIVGRLSAIHLELREYFKSVLSHLGEIVQGVKGMKKE